MKNFHVEFWTDKSITLIFVDIVASSSEEAAKIVKKTYQKKWREKIIIKQVKQTMEESLGFGHLGNGIIAWDSNRERNGDYLTVAHISEQGVVEYRRCTLSDKAKAVIESKAQRVKDELKIQELLSNSDIDERKQKWELELKNDASFGYYFDGYPNKWVAFDNRSHECNVEEFNSEIEAQEWLTN